jgi:nitrile hydratase subunit beta
VLTQFEHFAATSLLGSPEAPPRNNGELRFASEWERRAFGLAVALSKAGHFEWEDFREALIDEIRAWEATHDLHDCSWNYYERWLAALERVLASSGLVAPQR